ncbi:Oxoglutarate/iron-dependent dioxygenase [Penicillium sp. IBT 16267x]|nr:Oxoglutarate/iron-dependent dioxygenase [Penicillium sp. IBT 16267x]
MTLLFQQPVAISQVQSSPESEWEYLHVPAGTIAVNLADVLQFWTNGYLKPGFYRVIAPREDQAHVDRLALFYIMRLSDKLLWKALDNPFLEKVGYGKKTIENDMDISRHDLWRKKGMSRTGRNYNK